MGGFEQYSELKKNQEDIFNEADKQQDEWQPIDLFHQDYDEEVYNKEKNKGLGEDVEDKTNSFSYVQEKQYLKEANSTFAERTEYYFKDAKYMESKVARYRSLAADNGGEIEAFAKKHSNRSARKRKKKAKAAAVSFDKARQLEETYKQKNGDMNLSGEDMFKARQEIMKARMEGMINAAKVKATSKEDEKFRIAKAQYSCLTALRDQIEHLRIDVKGKDVFFDSEQEKLETELKSAKKALKKYGNIKAKWMEAQGGNDTENLKKELKETGNPYATIDDLKLSHLYNGFAKEYERPEYRETAEIANKHGAFGNIGTRRDELTAPICMVKRDIHGNPINKEEIKKEEWNKKWLEAVKDPNKVLERKKMLIESMNRFKQIELPSLEEIERKGMKKIVEEDPEKIFSIIQFSLKFDNIRPCDPILTEYIEFDDVFRAKMEAGKFLGSLAAYTLKKEFNISQGAEYRLIKGDAYFIKGQDNSEKARRRRRKEDFEDEDELRLVNGFLDSYKKFYPLSVKLEAEQKDAYSAIKREEEKTFKEAQKTAEIKEIDLTEEKYNLFIEFRNTNRQLDCPDYRRLYAATGKKLGNDISRICGAMLRPVHFNDKWEPISNEDMAAHEWNINFLRDLNTFYNGPILEENNQTRYDKQLKRLQEGKITRENFLEDEVVKGIENKTVQAEANLRAMIEEEILRYLTGFYSELPTPEEIKKEFVEPALKGDIPDCEVMEKINKNKEAYTVMALKSLTWEGILKREFGVDLGQKYKSALDAFQVANGVYGYFVDCYFGNKYNLSINTGSNAGLGKSPISKDNLEVFSEMYEKKYNAFMVERNKIKGGAA